MYDLSIIIPHYNSVNSLEKLLLSIPEKEGIQIIVVDDKSEEENYLISNSQFDHVLFLDNETPNKGAGTCRNIGLDYAEGRWLLFADADDYFVENFYSLIQKYFDSRNDVVFFNPTSIAIDTGQQADRHIKYEKLIKDYLEKGDQSSIVRLKYRFFVPWSKLIRNEFIQSNRIFFDEVIASNDVMFSTKVGYHMQTFQVDQNIIYCVTRGFGTLTTNINSHIYDVRIDVFINYYNFLKNKLSKSNFKNMELHGLGILINGVTRKIGIKKLVSVHSKLRKNNVAIFTYRMFNPFYSLKKVKKQLDRQSNNKRFLS